ncbi:Mannose-1-phosphate guanyltransferase beta [Fasciolopsis buskii]|uniref:mannose-1-phosphate guanylyltransferase n=1 Tax=Fasciolopsis buskii TaxID=27845 RepID=A0A8E0RN22_9TREM|nr:Mannose-1-phosphate guanyltransferase beta [Fasciolopsis buski]
MKAVILIGGYGTRLRPLTLSIPKPIVEFCNRPMLLHQVEALMQIEVDEIILAINRQATALEPFIRESCKSVIRDKDVKITFSYEDEALDTAGPLAQAAGYLDSNNESFLVLNSDIICRYPFKQMIEFHRSHGHEGTMVVTKVEEPSKYGAVVHNDQTGLVKHFVEKPSEYIANRVNAGLYMFKPSILTRVQAKPTSIETSIFPAMVSEGELYCMELEGE